MNRTETKPAEFNEKSRHLCTNKAKTRIIEITKFKVVAGPSDDLITLENIDNNLLSIKNEIIFFMF